MAEDLNLAAGRYRIEAHLGEGGLSEVFRAFDTRLRRPVAIKRLSPGDDNLTPVAFATVPTGNGTETHARGWREAILLATVQHPNVITVYDFDQDEAGPFLVLELVPGETLEAVVGRGALGLADFLILAQQSLEGLAAAHGSGLFHCDLKPGNLMLNYNALGRLQIKLLDFGIAGYSADPAAVAAPRQSPGGSRTVLGTVEFMAPERFEHRPVSARTELYSMGCIFYYALTGVDPFGGRTEQEVMASHLDSLVVDLSELRRDLPLPLCRWIMRLISRDPAARPGSVLEALGELAALRL